jgi:erythromycin esterase
MYNMKTTVGIYFCLFVATACFAQKTGKKDSSAAIWLRANVNPLKSVRAGSGFDDLQCLVPLLKDKEIIGLGEATHGTKEFFMMKHRLVEFLVEKMGFHTFAIEANMPYCEAVNDYICHDKGSLEKVVAGMGFWTWNTIEVTDMVKWMKKYNSGKPDSFKIHFYGFDMQSPDSAASRVKRIFTRSEIRMSASMSNVLDRLSDPYAVIKRKKAKEWHLFSDSLKIIASANQEKLKKNLGETGYVYFLQEITLLKQYIEMTAHFSKSDADRDLAMAENIKWLHEQPRNLKMILWAHNGHITKKLAPSLYFKISPMGGHLAKMFGNKYYNIGFDFYDGMLRAVGPKGGLRAWTAKPSVKKSSGYIFHRAGIPCFFLNLDKIASSDTFGKYVTKPILNRNIGALYNPKEDWDNYSKETLSLMYNGIIFIDHTTASVRASDFGNVMSNISAETYREKQIKITMKMRLDGDTSKGDGHLWLRVDVKKGRMGFFNNMDANPVRQNTWKDCEIIGEVSKDAVNIAFGAFLNGNGKLLVDDFHFYVKENNQWQEVQTLANSFENDISGKAPVSWFPMTPTYNIIVTENESCIGRKCVLIEKKD